MYYENKLNRITLSFLGLFLFLLNFQITAQTDCDTLNYPLVGYPWASYANGTNYYHDKAKVNYFANIQDGQTVQDIYIKFIWAKGTTGTATVAVWKNTGISGTPANTPIATKSISISTIKTDIFHNALTHISFSSPVTLSGPCYIGVILPTTYAVGDSVILGADTLTNFTENIAWEQFSGTGGWHAYTEPSSWKKSARLAVFPVICSDETGYTVSGSILYNNSTNSVLPSATVHLMSGSILVASTITNANGVYYFNNIPNGTYTLAASTERVWDGVTAIDVLKIKRHIAGLELLTEPIRYVAADVNVSGTINATDVLKIQRRISGLDAEFILSDWIFAKPGIGGNSIIVNGTNVSQNLFALCAGDVNGSLVPVVSDKVIISNNPKGSGFKQPRSLDLKMNHKVTFLK